MNLINKPILFILGAVYDYVLVGKIQVKYLCFTPLILIGYKGFFLWSWPKFV